MRMVILGLFVIILAQWLITREPLYGMSAAIIGVLWVVSVIVARKRQSEDSWQPIETKNISPEYVSMVQESWEKAQNDHQRLAEVQTKIQDAELRKHLGTLVQVSSRILAYLKPRAERVLTARRFIDYYQDRAVKLSEEYQSLEQTGLETEQVRQTRARLKETLFGFEAAYAAEFEKIINPQLMDMDAEMSVMQQHFKTEGLSDTEEHKNAARQERRDSASLWRQTDCSVVPPEERGNVIKNKIILSLLAIFLGSVGAHKFYRGKTFQGVLYVMFCWSFLPAFIGFCEGMRYLFMPVDHYYKKYYR